MGYPRRRQDRVLSCLFVMLARAFRTARVLQRPRAASFRTGVALRASWDDGTRSYPEKSETCVSTTGAPLTEYYSLEAAERGAYHVVDRYGTVLEPRLPAPFSRWPRSRRERRYRCDRCSLWHLAPGDSRDDPLSFEETVDDDDHAASAFADRDEASYAELQQLFDREVDLEFEPAWRRTRACGCTGADGSPKRSYDRREAHRQVASGAERGVRLAVYECPERRGAWHLTRS